MKERVEAAFVAKEQDQDQRENVVSEIYNAKHATSPPPNENNEDVITDDDINNDKPEPEPSEYSEPEEQPELEVEQPEPEVEQSEPEAEEEKFLISRKNHHHHQSSTNNPYAFVATSEESSNDTDETGNDVKNLKNVILRNCFASLHRRQQKEKEKEYDQYLKE